MPEAGSPRERRCSVLTHNLSFLSSELVLAGLLPCPKRRPFAGDALRHTEALA